jgi:hypothetical protein
VSSSSDESVTCLLCLLKCAGLVVSSVCFRFLVSDGSRLVRFKCGAVAVSSSSSSSSSSSASSLSVSS